MRKMKSIFVSNKEMSEIRSNQRLKKGLKIAAQQVSSKKGKFVA